MTKKKKKTETLLVMRAIEQGSTRFEAGAIVTPAELNKAFTKAAIAAWLDSGVLKETEVGNGPTG